MAEKSSIEWTDATWNPLRGCTKISAGCKHCYAEVFAERFRGVPNHPYEQGFDLRLVPEKLEEPLRWKTPKRIFVNSMSDLFQPGVPVEYIARVAEVMIRAPWHTFQVLTKRADLGKLNLSGIHWVIVGGESGHGARPMSPDWVASLKHQCKKASVPFFFKQWGGRQKSKSGRLLEGRTHDEMPVQTPLYSIQMNSREFENRAG